MKRFFISLIIGVVGCQSFNQSADITGDYYGTLPCGSCEGIEVSLTLDKEGFFFMEETFLGEEKITDTYKGKYQQQGDVITLIVEGDMPTRLKITAEKLNYLGEDDQILEAYSLKKQ